MKYRNPSNPNWFAPFCLAPICHAFFCLTHFCNSALLSCALLTAHLHRQNYILRAYVASPQKSCKNGYQTFLFLWNITGFIYFVPNILSVIVWASTFLVLTRPSLLPTSIFLTFSDIFSKNIKQVSCAKATNLMVLCKHYFTYLV